MRRTRSKSSDPGPPPTRSDLHEAALAYLARGAASAAMVSRVLERKAAAWARRAARTRDPEVVAGELAACRETIAAVVSRLREVRLLDDAAFAETRARRLGGEGRSRRAIAAHLAAKGVDSTTARQVLPDAESELAAALVFARKRRIGPFERDGGRSSKRGEDEERQRGLAAMARAGYDWDLCERIFGMDPEQAEEIIARSRR